MIKSSLIIAMVLQWLIRPVAAENLTGNLLYFQCGVDGTQEPIKWGICYGYVQGVFDALADVVPFCGWDRITHLQMHDIVYQYLQTHPAERQLDAHYLVARAFRQAYPCK